MRGCLIQPEGSATFVSWTHQQAEQLVRAQVQQCRKEKTRLQAECSDQGGLTGLILNGLILKGGLGNRGVVARQLPNSLLRPGDSLFAKNIISGL